jgi:septal ring factor EnvC (AmiA/AmiB activator)
MLGLGLVLILGAAGFWAWNVWDRDQRLQTARDEYRTNFTALASPLAADLSRGETTLQRLTSDITAALAATRVASIVPAKLEADATLLRQDLSTWTTGLASLQELESKIQAAAQLRSRDGLAGASEQLELQSLTQRLRTIESQMDAVSTRVIQVAAHRQNLIAQAEAAALARREREAAARAQAQREASQARERETVWVQPRFNRPTVVVAPSYGYGAYPAYGPTWGHRRSFYGNDCHPYGYHRSRSSVGLGFSFVFR